MPDETVGLPDYSELSTRAFRVVYRTLLSLAPGLHPDDIGVEDGGWEDHPTVRAIGREARRRHEEGEFTDEDLYDAEAQRIGLA